jgi:flagellar hook-length control protein FliK
MKDLLPLTSIQTHSSSDLTTTAAKKAGAETSLNGIVSGISGKQTNDGTTFIDSLNDLVQARLAPDDAVMPTANGGKALPLSAPAAESIRSTISPLVAEEQIQTDADAMAISALPLSISPTEAPVDMPTTVATLSDPNKVIASTASQSFDTVLTDNSLAMVNKSVAVEQLIARDSTQTTNTMQSLNAMNTAESPVIMQLSTMRPPALSQDLEQPTDPIERDLMPRSKPMHAPGPGEWVNRQQALTTEGALNETDLLFTSRMQSASVSSTLELTSQKLVAESILNTTQPASNDVLNTSPLRSPLPQTGAPAESMTTNSQSFIPETLGKADWGQGMSKQILWMVNQSVSRAEIRLNPANLGPLEVLIDMDNDQVNVAFSSRNADVREAVEQAMPRLREMLEEKGLNLSNTDVSQHSFAEQRQNAFAQADQNSNSFTSSHSSGVMDDQLPGDSGQSQLTQAIDGSLNNGLVDYYI